MLSLYGSFKVPDVDRVTLFRDDEKPHKFYMITDKPVILRASDGTPLLDFISYARNPDVVLANLEEGEALTDLERGHMQLTVGLQVSESDQEKIRIFLKAKLKAEASKGFFFLKLAVVVTDPELGYPPFYVGGSASVNTFNDDLQHAGTGTTDPVKSGVCPASFSYDLTQEGAALMLQSLRSDSLPIVARYEGMKFAARIPALKITITGDRSEIFKEFKQKLRVVSRKMKNGKAIRRRAYSRLPTLGDFRSTYHSLTVTIDDSDFRESDGSDDATAMLEQMAMDILENNILPTFFEPMLEAPDENDDNQKSGWWLRDETTEFSGSINVSFTKRDVVLMEHSANGQVGGELTETQKDEAVRVLDLSRTEHEFMKMVVFPNINFDTDPIFALQVFVNYEEFDEIENRVIKHHQEAVFQKDSQPVRKVFKLARAADGTAKERYRYSSVLTYKSSASLSSVVFPPQGSSIESTSKNLIITYPTLGHIKSMITLGSLPENIVSAMVTVRYIDASIADFEQVFFLDRDNASAVYLLHTNRQDAEKKYNVSTVFRLVDGSEVTKGPQEYTGESVVISSPFDDTLETVFAATGNFTDEINSISLVARYNDLENGHSDTFFYNFSGNGETVRWNTRLIDKEKKELEYDIVIFNKNGTTVEEKDVKGVLGDLITVGISGRSELSVMVDAGNVDWDRFSHLFVQLEYVPPAGGDIKRHNIRMTQEGFVFEEWLILISDPDALTYKRRAIFIGKDASDRVGTQFEESNDPFFMPVAPALITSGD